MDWRRYFILLVALIYLAALFVTPQSKMQRRSFSLVGLPQHAFGDGVYYLDLTKAVARTGRLYVYDNMSALGSWYKVCGYSLGADGRVYIAFSPGISLLAVPFYVLGGTPGIYVLNALLGVLTAYYIYKCCGLFAGRDAAVKTALVFAFCTMLFTYSQVFYSEALACLLVASSFYYLSLWFREGNWRSVALAGMAAGMLPITKPTLALLTAVFWLWLAAERDWRGLGVFTLAAVPFTAAFMAYNSTAFGSPFATSYSSQIAIDADGGLYVRDQTGGSFWGNNPVKAFAGRIIVILLTQPVLIVSALGLARNKGVKEVRVVLLATLLILAVYSFRSNPLGLWGWGDRLAVPLIPLLSIPYAISLEKRQVGPAAFGILTYASLYLTVMSLDTGLWHLFTQFPPVEWISGLR